MTDDGCTEKQRLVYNERVANEIVAAVITGVCGILAGAAPSVIRSFLDDRRRFPSTRAQAIPGTWSGSGKDTYVELDKPFLDFDLTLFFEVNGKKIRGVGDLASETQRIAVECHGGFLNEDYMQFIYRSRDRTRQQMGVIVFRLNDEGNVLTGHYAGLSPLRGVFVSGVVSLKKVASRS